MPENGFPETIEDNLFENLAAGISEGVYYVTADHVVVFWNKKAETITGYTRFEVTGMNCSNSIFHPFDETNCDQCTSQCPLAATLADGETREVDAYLRKKSGEKLPARLRCSPVRDHDGKILGAIEVFSDKTFPSDTTEEIERLRQEANTDSLTGVGNRRFAELVLHQFEGVEGNSGPPFGVIFFDIDHFKDINDSWGHDVGDLVLQQIAWTVKKFLRPEDLLCRWGGEEFVVLVPKASETLLIEIGERIRLLIQESPLRVEERDLKYTVSVGVSLHLKDESVRKTITRADDLMYQSKKAGRNRVST